MVSYPGHNPGPPTLDSTTLLPIFHCSYLSLGRNAFINHVTYSFPSLNTTTFPQCSPAFHHLPLLCSLTSRKPRGYWSNIENIKQQLQTFQQLTPSQPSHVMPTARQLRQAGRRDLDNAILKMGGYPRVAQLLGWTRVSKRREAGYWSDFANLQKELKMFLHEHRHHVPHTSMPTQKLMRALRRSDIADAIGQHGGSAEVAKQLGLSQSTSKRRKYYWKDWARVEAEVRAFVQQRNSDAVYTADRMKRTTASSAGVRRMPSQRELRVAGRADLAEAIYDYHGGFREVAKKLGYVSNKKDDFFYDHFYNLAKEVYNFVNEAGQESVMPCTSVLKAARRTDLSAAIIKFGGMAKVSQRLGLQYRVRTRDAFKDWGVFSRSLRAFMKTHGSLNEVPSSRITLNYGRSDLHQAILHHGGARAVADRMGVKRNYWQDFSNVGLELLRFIDTHGTEGVMPTESDFLEVGRSSLNLAVAKFGHSQVAQRLGLSTTSQPLQNAFNALLNQPLFPSEDCEECDEQIE